MNPKFFRNGIVMLVLVVGTAALLFTWLSSSSSSADVSYSDFLAKVQAGQVDKVVQQDTTLTVTPKGGGAAYTVNSPGLAGLHDVFADIQAAATKGNVTLAADAYSVKPVPDTSWLGLLLTGLLPLVVIGGFIFFMMRQAQGTNNQALS
ncbi:MAG: ATP-dependent metallopeptidase FtsH/Yme1/Tma family protein, partial [Candidatus Limnocylindrales bacterium]